MLVAGVGILVISLVIWRRLYTWIIGLPNILRAGIILGSGERAHSIVETLRSRRDVGMEVVAGDCQSASNPALDRLAMELRGFCTPTPSIDRVVVAMEDRRGSMPVRELLALRLRGVVIEDASSLIERLTGKVPLDGLTPSTLIFTEGFNLRAPLHFVRRLVSIVVSFLGLAICMPFIPFIALAVRLSSRAPSFFVRLASDAGDILLPCSSSARWRRTQKQTGPFGLPKTTPESQPPAGLCARPASMRFRNSGTSCAETWRL